MSCVHYYNTCYACLVTSPYSSAIFASPVAVFATLAKEHDHDSGENGHTMVLLNKVISCPQPCV